MPAPFRGVFRSPSAGDPGRGFPTAVGGTTTAVWQSPPFTYAGTGGADPGSISFAMDRRANVDQLLAAAGSSAEYSVRLNDLSAGGDGVTLIAPTTLAGAGSWTGCLTARSIPPASRSATNTGFRSPAATPSGTSVLVTGSADYDNVVLSAVDGKGGGAFGSQRLEELLRQATPDTATLHGGRLLVRVNCPRKVGRQCRTTLQGLLKKNRPATNRRSVRLRSGKSKLVALKVKTKVRKQVAARRRILVRQKVRAGKVTATVFKTRLLIRR